MKTIRQLDYMGGIVKVDEIKEINFNETGDIIDTLSGISLKDTPEERVRQKFYYRLMKLKFVQILLFTRIKKHV